MTPVELIHTALCMNAKDIRPDWTQPGGPVVVEVEAAAIAGRIVEAFASQGLVVVSAEDLDICLNWGADDAERRAEKAEQRAERFRDLYSKRYSAIEQVRHVCQKARKRKNAPGMWLVAEQVLAALDVQDAASLPPEVTATEEET